MPPLLPPEPELPVTLVDRLAALEAHVLRNDARITALESTLAETHTEVVEKNDEMAKLAWAVKHGRQRPW